MNRTPLTFATLGPEGTCHEAALRSYIEFQELRDTRIVFVSDFGVAVDMIAEGAADFVLQGCAHPQVALAIERRYRAVAMIDTFLFPTKPLALLARRHGKRRTLGLMPATQDYLPLAEWRELIFETSNVVVAENLVAGKYDGAITFSDLAEKFPDTIERVHDIGSVQMAWLLYGPIVLRRDELIGLRRRDLFACGK